jgi:hypothetical protein
VAFHSYFLFDWVSQSIGSDLPMVLVLPHLFSLGAIDCE